MSVEWNRNQSPHTTFFFCVPTCAYQTTMALQQAAFTILHLLERLYDTAVVPETMEAIINPYDLEAVIAWQRRHPVEDNPRVLTVERLGDPNHAALMAFQMFAYNTTAHQPDFGVPEPDSDEDIDMVFNTAEEYVAYDSALKMDYYRETGKRMYQKDPDPSWFPNATVREEAMRLRCVVCVDPNHVGDRLLQPGQFYQNADRKCIECQRRKWRKPRIMYASADDWASQHPDTNPKPRETDFSDATHFHAALAIHTQRRKDYKKKHNQRPDVVERKNAKARATYAQTTRHVEDEDGDDA